jgi:radical SAM superfamily enzyme YgiQ (UPF0313 family)
MVKHRVCFVIPPSAFLLDERVFVSLGVLKVAAAIEARGYPVEVLDLSGVTNYEDAARAHARTTDARAFALTATTPQMPATARIIAALRAVAPDRLIVLGGPHVTLAAAAMKREQDRGDVVDGGRGTRAFFDCAKLVDAVVAGDGEDAIEGALYKFEREPKGRGIFIDADDPNGPLFLSRKRMEELPPPARHLVDLSTYHYTIDGAPATSLIAQLGCPFACSFCGGRASPMLRRARMRSTESVLAEVAHLHRTYGYCGFMFYDDEMNVSKTMVELMRGLVMLQKSLGVEFRLRGFVKAELLTQEQADVMHEAGFRWLLCGFESGHPRILDNINKKATVEDNDRAVAYARKAGLKVKALMSIGHAGESAETVEATRQWILRTRPDDFDCTVITPYPGSPYYDEAVRLNNDSLVEPLKVSVAFDVARVAKSPIWTYTAPRTGDRLHAFELDYTQEADYYKSTPGAYVSHVFTDHLSPVDLVKLRDHLEDSVRDELKVPFNPGAPGVQFEASMGQLPSSILRRSA